MHLSVENQQLSGSDLNIVDTGELVPPRWLRFDYDAETAAVQIEHPASYFTIEDNGRCRIPVTSPLTPIYFSQYIFDHFYYAERVNLPTRSNIRPLSIRDSHLAEIHVVIP